MERGKKSARLHHPLTYCPKEFRNCLRLGDEVLKDIDIATAQATLFYAHLREIGADAAEVGIYRQLLEEHDPSSPHDDIYKKLYARRKTIPLTDSERGKAKKQFYIYIFSGKWSTSRVANRMRKLMPRICSKVIEAGDASAADLQNMEAEIIIDGAVAHCMGKGTFCVPIHDGLICRKRDYRHLRGWIFRRLKEVTGLKKPGVTVDDLKFK